MPTVLFHTKDESKKAKILALCRTLDLSGRAVTDAEAGHTVGALAGLSAAKAPAETLPADYALPEVLVFSGDAGEALDLFLAAYRQAGIEPIALKAVVTPHNAAWSLRALTAELEREHAAMLLRWKPKQP